MKRLFVPGKIPELLSDAELLKLPSLSPRLSSFEPTPAALPLRSASSAPRADFLSIPSLYL